MQVTHGNLNILRKWKRKIYIEYIYIYNIALRFYMKIAADINSFYRELKKLGEAQIAP